MDVKPPVEPPPPPSPAPAAPPSGDARYVLAVGAMLVLIIGILAALWVKERRARTAAEGSLAEARVEADGLRAFVQKVAFTQGAVPQAGAGEAGVKPFTWAEDRAVALPPRVLLEEKHVVPLTIKTEAGARLGFGPGDLVYVVPGPASRPAASRPGAP